MGTVLKLPQLLKAAASLGGDKVGKSARQTATQAQGEPLLPRPLVDAPPHSFGARRACAKASIRCRDCLVCDEPTRRRRTHSRRRSPAFPPARRRRRPLCRLLTRLFSIPTHAAYPNEPATMKDARCAEHVRPRPGAVDDTDLGEQVHSALRNLAQLETTIRTALDRAALNSAHLNQRDASVKQLADNELFAYDESIDQYMLAKYVLLETRTQAELFATTEANREALVLVEARRDFCRALLSLGVVCCAYYRRHAADNMRKNQAESFFSHLNSTLSMAVEADVENYETALFHEAKWATQHLLVALGDREPREKGVKG